ncbi:hypothetical protein, partial [Cellulomonas sp. GbtcB1]|uniref:hypothetical protein n=1 Tax=Cellulomonas sp. GbtcB1 TaxID=2824746 RepID=UPI001C2F7861
KSEIAEVAPTAGTPRRTILLESAGGDAPAAEGAPAPRAGRSAAPALSLEVEDSPCYALLSATGLVPRPGSTVGAPRPAP